MGKVKITAEVVSQTCIATDIYSLILKAGEIALQAVAGQFVSVYSKDEKETVFGRKRNGNRLYGCVK